MTNLFAEALSAETRYSSLEPGEWLHRKAARWRSRDGSRLSMDLLAEPVKRRKALQNLDAEQLTRKKAEPEKVSKAERPGADRPDTG